MVIIKNSGSEKQTKLLFQFLLENYLEFEKLFSYHVFFLKNIWSNYPIITNSFKYESNKNYI